MPCQLQLWHHLYWTWYMLGRLHRLVTPRHHCFNQVRITPYVYSYHVGDTTHCIFKLYICGYWLWAHLFSEVTLQVDFIKQCLVAIFHSDNRYIGIRDAIKQEGNIKAGISRQFCCPSIWHLAGKFNRSSNYGWANQSWCFLRWVSHLQKHKLSVRCCDIYIYVCVM